MIKKALLVFLLIPIVTWADAAFIAKVDVPHLDQFTANGMVQDGHCEAGVAFVLEKSGLLSSLTSKVSQRLKEMGANAWVLVDYRKTGLPPMVRAVQVVPLKCNVQIGPDNDEGAT